MGEGERIQQQVQHCLENCKIKSCQARLAPSKSPLCPAQVHPPTPPPIPASWPCILQSSIPFRLGCGDLYISHRLGSRTRIALVKPKKGRRAAGGVTAASAGDPDRYSVLGQGYNVINGLPLSVGMSSLDPGLT